MKQSHDAEKQRGWVETAHPLVARGLIIYHQRHYAVNVQPNMKLAVRQLFTLCMLSVFVSWYSHLPQLVLFRRYWVMPRRETCLAMVHGPINQHCLPICWSGFQSTPSQLALFQHASRQAWRLDAACPWPPNECVFCTPVQQLSSVKRSFHEIIRFTYLETNRLLSK